MGTVTQDNGAENAAGLWLVLGIIALVGAVYVGEWIAYVAVGLTFVGVLAYFLWPTKKTRQR